MDARPGPPASLHRPHIDFRYNYLNFVQYWTLIPPPDRLRLVIVALTAWAIRGDEKSCRCAAMDFAKT